MRRSVLLLGLLWIGLSGLLATSELSRTPEVVIRWATESEVDTLGFNLYRATSPKGPFQQINPFLIPSSVDPLAGAEYEYLDSAVEGGQRYYYELEELEIDGTVNRVELTSAIPLGIRPWILLSAGGGALVGSVLFISGLRKSGRRDAAPWP
jgi:hypothetical protein